MTTPSNHTNDDHDAIPGDVRDLHAMLAQSARTDRAAAPAGLEDRLFAASRSALPAHALRLSEPFSPGQAAMGRRIAQHAMNSTFSRLRMAAAIALLVMGGLLALAILPSLSPPAHSTPDLATNPAPSVHLADADVADSVLSALALSDSASFTSELDSIRTATEALDKSIQNDGVSLPDLSDTGA
jgi:hypothetical protein